MTRGARLALLLLVAASGFAAGWHVMLWQIPTRVTDHLFARMASAGAQTNVLGKPVMRYAKGNIVPMANADTLVRSAMLDLSQGPLRFTATPPRELVDYWSVSVFAHNTDTLFVLNDTQVAPGERVAVQLRLADQPAPGPGVHDVVLPSARGFLLVRPTMPDRENPAAVAALAQALGEHRLEPAPADPQATGDPAP
jgi:uncharacterized membrane protein